MLDELGLLAAISLDDSRQYPGAVENFALAIESHFADPWPTWIISMNRAVMSQGHYCINVQDLIAVLKTYIDRLRTRSDPPGLIRFCLAVCRHSKEKRCLHRAER